VLLEELEGRVGEVETSLADLQRREGLARREITQFDLPLLEVKAAKANEVILWKAFSWTRLFNLLEELQPWDVQMASIHPSFRPQADGASGPEPGSHVGGVPVSVEGTARSLEAFLEFERALLRSATFSRIEPERTQRTPNTGEIVFALRFHYDPEAADGPPPRPDEDDAPAEEQEQEQGQGQGQGQGPEQEPVPVEEGEVEGA
jgi:hypothetical protein